mmetsp:Transcript_1951/g.7562  ORF Transcript_1951/g.7562 Transcript_1951/m.7562 type:complete len:205 (-) Transcript_1951:2075-2689(-)
MQDAIPWPARLPRDGVRAVPRVRPRVVARRERRGPRGAQGEGIRRPRRGRRGADATQRRARRAQTRAAARVGGRVRQRASAPPQGRPGASPRRPRQGGVVPEGAAPDVRGVRGPRRHRRSRRLRREHEGDGGWRQRSHRDGRQHQRASRGERARGGGVPAGPRQDVPGAEGEAHGRTGCENRRGGRGRAARLPGRGGDDRARRE